MLSSFLFGLAWADCPVVPLHLKRAEDDVVDYFIADAEKSLQTAVNGFGCATTTTEILTRYWLVRAMVWQLGESPKGEDALAAAKALSPNQFTDELGSALKNVWLETDPAPLSPSSFVKIRGLQKRDIVLVDTEETLPPTAPPGLHLIQVIRDGQVIMGKVVQVIPGSKLNISLPNRNQSTITVLTKGNGLDYEFPVPFKLKGLALLDANDERRSFHYDVLPASLILQQGRDTYRSRRRNSTLQVVATSMAFTGLYGVYLSSYKATHDAANRPGWLSASMLTGSIAAAGFSWEFMLTRKRRNLKKTTVELANQVMAHE